MTAPRIRKRAACFRPLFANSLLPWRFGCDGSLGHRNYLEIEQEDSTGYQVAVQFNHKLLRANHPVSLEDLLVQRF